MINAQKLRNEIAKHGSTVVVEGLTEAIALHRAGETGGISPKEFSIRDLAEGILGHEAVSNMNPNQQSNVSVFESSEAVDNTAFANITGQIVYTEIMDAYEQETFFASQMRTVNTRLSGERMPGFGGIGDAARPVHEGEPFPNAGITEDYTDTPETDKYGLIVPITKEAVFFDRTGVILQRANAVGEALGLNKEKRCIDVVIGATNNYNWRGVGYDTYNPDGPAWVNELQGAEFDLEDWTDIDAAERLFDDIVDPNTGEAIEIGGNNIICGRRRMHAANRITNATEIRYRDGNANTETIARSPIQGYTTLSNRRYHNRLKSQLGLTDAQAAATWLYGDFQKAFKYMQNWGITTVQAPTNAEAEFRQDIIAQFKASERGVAAVCNPRYIARIKGYAA